MGTTGLVRTRTVLQHFEGEDDEENGTVGFDTPAEPDEGARPNRLDLDAKVWEDMGSPEYVTLTVEPGDTLNG